MKRGAVLLGKAGAYMLLLIMLFSCQKELSDCFKNRGPLATDQRQLVPFNKIEVYDKIDLVLGKDSLSPEHATLEGWKNLLSSVELSVKDSTLIIRDNNTCNFVRNLDNRTTVRVSFRELKSLRIHDDAGVSTQKRLNLDSLFLWHQGMHDISMELNLKRLEMYLQSAGNANLSGYCAVFVCDVNDVGGVDARNFQGDYTFLFHNGTHGCYLKPLKVLGVKLDYSGNAYYSQKPLELSVSGKGTGRLIKE